MAHKDLIDGTAYEIDGGKAMVDGTVYEIDKGTTLVDGTAYEVGFGPKTVTIEVFGDGRYDDGDSYGAFGEANITHNGVMYETPATFEANVGDVIECYVDATDDGDIYVNGVRVAGYKYAYTVAENAIIELYASGNERRAYIKITEVPAGCFVFHTAEYHYIAEEGMTWAEWCNSEYNSTGFNSRIVVEGGYVKQYAGHYYALALNGVLVNPTDAIVVNAKYYNQGYPCTVTIQSDNKDYAQIEINGQVYFGNHVLELLSTTTIICKVQEWSGTAIVTLNGRTVASISNHTGAYKSYYYSVKRPVTIHGYYDYGNVGGRIDITEQ